MNEKSAPKTITLDRINSQSGKAEEIAFLEKIAKSIPEGTYLKDFFSKELVDFIAWRISNDWTCDLMKEYNSEIEEHGNHNAINSQQIAETKKYLKIANEKIETLELRLQHANQDNQDLAEKLNTTANELRQEREEFAEKYAAWYHKGNAMVEENLALDSEIIKLKAKIYDLEHQEDK